MTVKLEAELKIPDCGDVLAPKARTAAENALAGARDILVGVESVANQQESFAGVRKDAPVADYVKSALDNRKGLATHVVFIKRIKVIAAKQFATA